MIQNCFYNLTLGGQAALSYQIAGSSEVLTLSWPQFQIDGVPSGIPEDFRETGRQQLTDTIIELTAEGNLPCGAVLKMELRLCDKSPIIRFRYILCADKPLYLTKEGGESLQYFSYPSQGNPQRTEVRFSGYDELVHGYTLSEIPAFSYESKLMGPILTECRKDTAFLTAYEHGSQYPNKFIAFNRQGSGIALNAVKGNYWHGQPIHERAYETIWLQVGGVKGTERDLAEAYRTFQLKYCTLNAESRKPYIFYNTWAFQERNKFWNKQTYLASMNEARLEQEIDIAYKMGVDVYVIDTGWFNKTGDWEVNREKFPHGMERIKEKLDRYGMKLGLWFNPTVAAKSSDLLKEHPDALSVIRGKESQALQVWETEDSYAMCLVSDYWETFADKLIELADRYGVTYFKWDAVYQYGCNGAGHHHAGSDTPEEESRECYAFQIGLYLSKVVDKLCKAHPEAIVDVDITEGNRSFGLGFLSSGKYFSMNNGPYYPNYDITVPEDMWINIFVQPGPARTWIMRQNLCYDKWIPSVLMMCHYLPDDPETSQQLNLASLILGQNGIWGDLLNISDKGISKFGEVLEVYKRVRDDITAAYPNAIGRPGETFEVHEKINSANGRGVVVVFANTEGTYRYKMHTKPTDKVTIYGNAQVLCENDEIWVEVKFKRPISVFEDGYLIRKDTPDSAPGAAMLFFE